MLGEREESHFWVRVLVDLEGKKSLFLPLLRRDQLIQHVCKWNFSANSEMLL